MRRWIAGALAVALVVSVGGLASADEGSDLDKRVEALEKELAALKGEQGVAEAVDRYLAARGQDAMPSGGVNAGYDNGFYIRSGNEFELKVNALAQILYGATAEDDVNALQTNSRTGFGVSHLQLRLGGHAFTPNLKYFVQLELGGDNNAFASDDLGGVGGATTGGVPPFGDLNETSLVQGPVLDDAYVMYRLGEQDLWLKAGQYRIPFGSEMTMDEADFLFADRSIVGNYFNVGRSTGFSVIYKGEQFAVEGFVNNGIHRRGWDEFGRGDQGDVLGSGAGFNSWGDVPLFGARLWVDVMGKPGMSHSGREYFEDLALGVGVSGYSENRNDAVTPFGDRFEIWAISFNALAKWKNLAWFAELAYQNLETDTTGLESKPLGFTTSVSYGVPNSDFEVTARLSYLDPDDTLAFFPTEDALELGGAVTYYLNGPNNKVSADLTYGEWVPVLTFRSLSVSEETLMFRLMWQLMF